MFKKTIAWVLSVSIACGMLTMPAFAMEDTQDTQEKLTQNTQQVCSNENLPQGVPYRETNLPSFDEDATEDVRNLAPDEYVQPEEGFAQDSQLQASIEDGSQAQSFANQIAGVQDAQYDPMVHDTQVW